MSILMTKHSADRLQQRGIRPYQIEFLVDYGSESHTNGCIKYIFDKAAVRRFEKDKGRDVLMSQIVRELQHAYALTSVDGALVTAGWLTKSVRPKWGSFGKSCRHQAERWRKRH